MELKYVVPVLSQAEIMRTIRKGSGEEIRKLFEHLDWKKMRRLLRTLQPEDIRRVWKALGTKKFVEILVHLKDVEAVKLLRKLNKEEREELLEKLPERERLVYSFLLNFSKDSAGGWARTDVLHVKVGERVGDVVKELKKWNGLKDVVVVEDEKGTFVGIVTAEKLIESRKNERIENVAIGAETVEVDDPSEEVAKLFTLYNPPVIVVTDRGKAVGVITREQAVPLLVKEHEEDIAKMFAVKGIEHVWTPIRKAIKNRTPWLIINLFTEFIAASVVNVFDSVIKTMALLAVFMPIVPGDAGNATTQTMAIMVRALATGELDRTSLMRVFWKEFLLGLFNGVIVGIIAFLFTYFWKGNVLASLALALATPISLVVAGLVGVIIPLLLKKLGQDPASSSTIILTTITDAVGFASFLGIAAILMKLMGM